MIPDDEPFSGEGPKRSWKVIEPTSQPPPPLQPPAAAAGAPKAHGGGTAPTASCGSAAAASSTPQPPPPQALHQPPWALLNPAAHQCGPGGRCNRCPGAGAPTAARRHAAGPAEAAPAAAGAATPGPPLARTVVVVPGPQMRAANPYDGPPAAYPGRPAPPAPYAAAAWGGPRGLAPGGAPPPPTAGGARGAVTAAGFGAGRGMPGPAWGFAGVIAAQPVRPAAAVRPPPGHSSLGAGRGNLGIAAPAPATAWGFGDLGRGAVGAGGVAARVPASAPAVAPPGAAGQSPGDVLRDAGRLASLPVLPGPGPSTRAGLVGTAAPSAVALGAAECEALASAGAGPATPTRRLAVPRRQRGTPPEDTRSPQQKWGCLGEGAATARRGDGGRSPAASKGLDFGSTPARVGSPGGGAGGDSGPSPPLSRVLDYSSTPGPAAAVPTTSSEVRPCRRTPAARAQSFNFCGPAVSVTWRRAVVSDMS